MIKLENLENSAKMTLSMKVVAYVILLFTTVLTIARVTYVGTDLEAVLTITSLDASVEVLTGSVESVNTSLNNTAIVLIFFLSIIIIGISFVFLLIDRTKLSAVFHIVGLFFLLIYFSNFFVLNQYDGDVVFGVTLTIAYDVGYYLIIVALLLLLLSSFIKFKRKEANQQTMSGRNI